MKIAFAFDIDGTLTHRHDWVDARVVEKLRHLVHRKIPIALVTGRVFSYAKLVLHLFDFPYLLAVQNGADILEMPSKKHVRRHYLSGDLIPQIEAAYEGQEEDFIIYSGIDQGDFCYYRPENFSKKMIPYLKKLESLGGSPWKKSDFQFEHATFPLIKCFGKKQPMKNLHEKLLKNSNIEVSMIHDPVDPSLYLNLITHPKANKGGVLDLIRARYPGAHVIAAGDDFNDYKMLQNADTAIAIDTAPREVLDLADIKAKGAEECGIIDAIEEAISCAG